MERLSWYLKRLRVMEPGEVRHRIREMRSNRRLAAGQEATGHVAVRPAGDWRDFAFCTAVDPELPDLPWDMESLVAASAGWREGQWPALGLDWSWRAGDPDIWRRAPDTGRLWPADFFSAITYRAGNPHGDIRVAWEPGRLQQLVALALLARQGGEGEADDVAALICAQLRSWIAANPPYRGIHYISVMECALRLVAVCHALDLVRSRVAGPDATGPDETWAALLALVTSHAPLIAQRLSLFSSRGNHTIAECAGLIYAGTLFEELPGAPQWRKTGLDILRREAAHQVLSDGGGIERAFHYHRFVLDLLGLVDGLLSHRGETTPVEITEALARGRRFLAAVTLPDGETLPVGDGDGGYALSRFLRLGASEAAPVQKAAQFRETGYTVLCGRTVDGPIVLFDHGPLGMAPSFGHAHADALSLALYWGRDAFLIDPGTFTYTGDPAWRRYFRSTAAHNTVCVDGMDQARQETAFQWSAPRRCRLLRADQTPAGVVRMLGVLDPPEGGGYRHRRGVAYAPDEWIYVRDDVDGEGTHAIAQHWHCGVEVEPADKSGQFALRGRDRTISVELRGAGAASGIVSGATEPPLGWRSAQYGRKEPCTVLRCVVQAGLPVTFETIVTLRGAGPDESVLAATAVLWQKWTDDAGSN